MNDYHEALTYRWREVVTDQVRSGNHDYPVSIKRSESPHGSKPMWEYWMPAARNHLGWGHCKFVDWVKGGQEGSLSSVTCDGDTGVDQDTPVIGPGGQPVTIPPKIQCGMGSILEMVENWAWGEREVTYYELPLFDAHNVGWLTGARRARGALKASNVTLGATKASFVALVGHLINLS